MKRRGAAPKVRSPRRKPSWRRRQIHAVDLFCGAGGLTHGLESVGIHVAAGVDLDPYCRYPFEQNNKASFHRMDVKTLTVDQVRAWYPKTGIKLLAGCAPCQPFSTYTQGQNKSKDDKWELLDEFGRIVAGLQPELVTMENVPQLSQYEIFDDYTDLLEDLGYCVSYSIAYCPEYGIPQTRRRIVLLASRFGEVAIVPPTHKNDDFPTVRSVIEKLLPIAAGASCPTDPLHRSSSLSKTNTKRIKASKPGGTWRDWNKDLVAKCHRKKNGKTYPGVYGRMTWNEPAPTITTQFFGFGNGRFGHPEQDRAISLREGALLQTFPPEYDFLDPELPFSMGATGRLIGNAVPVTLAAVVGKSFLDHVEYHYA